MTDLDFLAAGETVTVVFTITVDDGNGGTDTQNVTILTSPAATTHPVITPVDVTGNDYRRWHRQRNRFDHLHRSRPDRPADRHRSHQLQSPPPRRVALTARATDSAGKCLHYFSAAAGNTNNGTINWDYTIADADLDFLAAGEDSYTRLSPLRWTTVTVGQTLRLVTILVSGS